MPCHRKGQSGTVPDWPKSSILRIKFKHQAPSTGLFGICSSHSQTRFLLPLCPTNPFYLKPNGFYPQRPHCFTPLQFALLLPWLA